MNRPEKPPKIKWPLNGDKSTRLILLASVYAAIVAAVLSFLLLYFVFSQNLLVALPASLVVTSFWLVIFFILSLLLRDYFLAPLIRLAEIVTLLDDNILRSFRFKKQQGSLDQLEKMVFDMVKKINNYDKDIAEGVIDKAKDILVANKLAEKTKLAMVNVLEDVEFEKERNKAIAKDLEKFKLALDNASDAVIISDKDGQTLYINQAVEMISGYNKSEILGTKAGKIWGNLMSSDYYQSMWKVIKTEQKNFLGQITNKRKNGEIYDSLVSISPVIDRDGQVEFFVSIERDITREKNIDKAKTEFVSIVSHQLRTPLSSIKWYAEMLLAGDCGQLSREQINVVKEMYDSNQRMLNLINSLLNVSRLDFGDFAIDPQPNDIKLIADSVIKELRPIINEKKIRFSCKYAEKLPLINLDAQLIRIVFQNILSNAFKYTPTGGSVSLTVRLLAKNLLVDIKDSGYGIPRNQQDKIFNKFFRADNVKKMDVGGTGLGLYIVKSILDLSGGKISFKSTKTVGTVFTFSIPLVGMKKKIGSKRLA